MPEKSDRSSRRSSKPKVKKGVKRVAKIKEETRKSASDANEQPSLTNDGPPVLRTSRIGRLIRNPGWASVFVGAAVAVSVAIPMVIFIEFNRPDPARDSVLQARLKVIENSLARVGITETKIKGVDGRLSDLDRDFIAFRNTLADLEAQVEDATNNNESELAVANWESRFTALTSEIHALRSSVGAGLGEGTYVGPQFDSGLLLAVGQLRSAIARGEPYADEWDLTRALAKSTPPVLNALERLMAHRNQGVPTQAELERRFPALARSLIRAEATRVSSGWWDRTLIKLSEVVSVRPIGPGVIGDDVGALTARAEARLVSGNLAEAITMIAKLDARIGLAGGWLDAARVHLEAESLLDELTRQAIALTGKSRQVSIPERASP